MQPKESGKLQRTLGPWMLWGLGVGYVISGMYFGWNLGLPAGGVGGMGVAVVLMTLMYITFIFSYTELAAAIPRAGGAFDYVTRALGVRWGFLAGMAQNIEFIFAPPAIALSIGAYFHLLFPNIPVWVFAVAAYLTFTLLNVAGVKAAARFELIVTLLAVGELLLFSGVALPHFDAVHFSGELFPNGFSGIWAAIPFAIWFYLAIEGVANVSEETINPQKNILIGFGSAMLTLVVLCALTFFAAIGVGGWEAVVYPDAEAKAAGIPSDSPLPLALGRIYSEGHVLYRMLVSIGLFGLVASFHGILLAGGRATFEFGRIGLAPAWLGNIHPKTGTPANALWFNLGLGLLAVATGRTGDIIILACFGAVTMYILSLWALFRLRKDEPHLERPFRVPLFPAIPAVALLLALVALAALTYSYPLHALFFAGILAAAYALFYRFVLKKGLISPPGGEK